MRRDDVIRKILYAPARLWLRRKSVSLPLDAHAIRKILLLRTDAIGDMIVTTPMFTLLHERLHAVIDVVASPRNAALLSDDPRIRKTFVFDGSMKSLFAIRRTTRREHYDLVIALVLHRTTKGGLYANVWAGREATTVTFAHNSRTEAYQTWFSAQVDVPRDKTTMADMQIQMLNKLFGWNVKSSDVPLSIHLPQTVRVSTNVDAWHGSPRIVLNISSGNATRWSFERNRDFLTQLLDRYPKAEVKIMAHGADVSVAEQLVSAFELVTTMSDDAHSDYQFASLLPQSQDVRISIGSMKGADVLVTPDTSIVHGAAAMGIPVVGLYSTRAASPKEWTPHLVPYKAVYTKTPDSVETIEPERVVQATSDLLDEIQTGLLSERPA